MQPIETSDLAKKKRGWVGAAFFAAAAVYYIVGWLVGPKVTSGRLLAGLAFLMVVPQAFIYPIRVERSFLSQFKVAPRSLTFVDWLSMAGVAILILGIVIR